MAKAVTRLYGILSFFALICLAQTVIGQGLPMGLQLQSLTGQSIKNAAQASGLGNVGNLNRYPSVQMNRINPALFPHSVWVNRLVWKGFAGVQVCKSLWFYF